MNPEATSTGYRIETPLATLWDILPTGQLVPVAFTIIFGLWAIYTLVVAYHWIRYGHQSWMAFPAIAAHLFVSGWLIVYATAGFH